MKEKVKELIGKNLKIVTVVVIIMFLILNLYLSPALAGFISVVTAVAVISSYTVYKIFVYHVDEGREELPNCISDVADLQDIKKVINLSLPFAIISKDCIILAFNDRFRTLLKRDATGENISTLIKDFDYHINKQNAVVGESVFDVFCSKITDEEKEKVVYSLCFVDISERERMKKQADEQRTVSGLIFIDNYDEVTEALDDSQTPLLMAKIEKKLNKYISDLGGFLKRFEKDRYLFAISVGALEKAKEKKFEILSEIKAVNVGSHIPVTLSIGIGISYESLEGASKNAKDAMDLALGRGGDQVLIKDGGRYVFFGGKSGEVSHNARIRARVKADALVGLFRECDMVFVMGHKNADFDSLGAAIGVCRMAKDLGTKSHIVLTNPSKGVEPLYDLLIKSEEHKGMFVKEELVLDVMTEKTLVVVVDTYIPHLVESVAALDEAKRVVVIDHHRKSADYIEKAVLVYHEPYASSTSELVTELIRYVGDKVTLKQIEADALLAGITVDTKSFGIKAGAITFEAAALLRRNGADVARVKKFFRSNLDAVKIRSATVGDALMYKGGIIISVCRYNKEGANIICAQAADELLNIVDVRATVVLCKVNDTVYLSSRSYGEVNVQMMLEKIGGGGHQTMAGAQFEDITIEEAETKLKTAIDEYLKEEN